MFLGLRGEIGIAMPLGAFGLGLLGWVPFGPAGFSERTRKAAARPRACARPFWKWRSITIPARCAGTFWPAAIKGAALESLDVKTLVDLLAEVDDESRALLMPYLDRRDARWREYAQGDAAAGRAAASSGKMSEQEAYQILGLEPGASADDIGRAHRTLMKKFHPDQGGSTYLAARINEAKEILLRRHR